MTPYMDYGQDSWLANRTWIPYSGSSTAYNIASIWNPFSILDVLSILDMALVSII